jgi:hypothetical protein
MVYTGSLLNVDGKSHKGKAPAEQEQAKEMGYLHFYYDK